MPTKTIAALAALLATLATAVAVAPVHADGGYTVEVGSGSCAYHPEQPICSLSAPTFDNPFIWNRPVATPKVRHAVHEGHQPYNPPTVYVSADGYHWVLRPGRPR